MPTLRALIWRRTDFRESSRIVTLITRAEGRVAALAKGAHRPQSQFLGRIDLLNLVDARVSGRGSLRLLSRIDVLEDRRSLRQGPRFLAASHLVELFEPAFLDGRVDEPLFDLLLGAIHLLERCPPAAIPQVLLGVELRYLEALGLLPPLRHCGLCASGPTHLAADRRSLRCAAHREGSRTRVDAENLAWLVQLAASPGKAWPSLPSPPRLGAVLGLVGGFLEAAVERQLRLRRAAFGAEAGPGSA